METRNPLPSITSALFLIQWKAGLLSSSDSRLSTFGPRHFPGKFFRMPVPSPCSWLFILKDLRRELSPLECAVTKIALLTPLECAVTKKVGGGAHPLSQVNTNGNIHHAAPAAPWPRTASTNSLRSKSPPLARPQSEERPVGTHRSTGR